MSYIFEESSGGTSSPSWTPTNLGSQLVLWLDPTYGVTKSSNLISKWVSRDQNGWTFSQASGSAQPSYVASQTSNGGPIVRFNGSTTYMTSDLIIPLGSASTGFSWYLVMKHNGFTGSPSYEGVISSLYPGGSDATWLLLSNDIAGQYGTLSLGSANPSFASYSGNLSPGTTSFDTYLATYNGAGPTTATNYSFGYNNTKVTGSTGGGYGAVLNSTVYIGSNPATTLFLNSDVAGIFCFNQPLSAANDSLLRTYIATL